MTKPKPEPKPHPVKVSKPLPVCPQADSCELYALFKLAGTREIWQIRYCASDYTACERYKKSALGDRVPQRLLPNGKLLGRS